MVRLFVAVLVLAALVSACSGAPSTTPPTDTFPRPSATLERPPTTSSLLDGTLSPPPDVTGKFIFAPGDGSIWVQDPASGAATPIIKPTPELFSDAPAWSPDGEHFVYTRSALLGQGGAQNAIYRARADGTGGEPLALPPTNKTALNWSHYSFDGKFIYYTASTPVPPNKQDSAIMRVLVAGGEPEIVIQNARMSSVSPDNTKIAFVRFNFEEFTSGLWIADIDGQNERELVNDQVFLMVSAPQFSPDGSQILFAASGPNTRPLPGIESRYLPACEPKLLCWFAQTAYADGLPWDLWTVTPDGSKFTRLTEVGADSPWPAWSRDGSQVAFFDTSGQYLLDIATRQVGQITRNGGHGVFGWHQDP